MKLLLLACSSLLLVLLASQPASAGVEYFLDYFRAECENRGYPGGGTVTYCDVKLDVSGYGLWRIGKCTRKFFTDSCHVVTRKNLDWKLRSPPTVTNFHGGTYDLLRTWDKGQQVRLRCDGKRHRYSNGDVSSVYDYQCHGRDWGNGGKVVHNTDGNYLVKTWDV